MIITTNHRVIDRHLRRIEHFTPRRDTVAFTQAAQNDLSQTLFSDTLFLYLSRDVYYISYNISSPRKELKRDSAAATAMEKIKASQSSNGNTYALLSGLAAYLLATRAHRAVLHGITPPSIIRLLQRHAARRDVFARASTYVKVHRALLW